MPQLTERKDVAVAKTWSRLLQQMFIAEDVAAAENGQLEKLRDYSGGCGRSRNIVRVVATGMAAAENGHDRWSNWP